jgi:hypothetical protein
VIELGFGIAHPGLRIFPDGRKSRQGSFQSENKIVQLEGTSARGAKEFSPH